MADLPPFQNLYCNPSQWVELCDALETALTSLPENTWRPTVDRPSDKMVGEEEKAFLRQQILGAYKQHAGEVLKAVLAYLRDGRWPALLPSAVYYLRQMLAKALCFLQGIVVDKNGAPTTIFPFPNDAVPAVFLWFAVEWWLEYGLLEIVDEATSDQALFHKYFA